MIMHRPIFFAGPRVLPPPPHTLGAGTRPRHPRAFVTHQGRTSFECGFTLVELILVVFLIALVAGLALPAVGRGVDTLQLRAEAAAFSAFLRYARAQAITRHEAQEVTVNPSAHVLTLRATGGDSVRVSRRLSPRIAITAESPAGLSITFTPRGLSSGGSFRLVGADGRAYWVRVDPLTGRVTNARGS